MFFGRGQLFRTTLRTCVQATTQTAPKSSPFRHVFWVFPSICFGLSYWQWERLKWKEDILIQRARRVSIPTAPLPDLFFETDSDEEVKDWDLRAVQLEGQYLHNYEFHVGTRTYQNRAGYHIITPLLIKDTNKVVLVNRGWVPYANKLAATREHGQIEGNQKLNALVRLSQKPGAWTPPNDNVKNLWFFMDAPAMIRTLNNSSYQYARHIVLDLTAANELIQGGPIPGQSNVTVPNNHMNYMVTWAILGVCLSFLSFRISRKGISASMEKTYHPPTRG